MITESVLRIAAYGFVDRDAGSVASANFVILEELLRRGHSVDFYAIKGFIHPEELRTHPNFHYRPISIPRLESIWRFIETRIPGRLRSLTSLLFSQLSNALFEREIERKINLDHEEDPYNFFVMLGGLSPFCTPGLLNIAWPQGPPDGEWDAIRSQQKRVRELAGRAHYEFLRLGYIYKGWQNRVQSHNSDLILCGSEWARSKWVEFGVPSDRVLPLPYPYDLDRFHPMSLPGGDHVTFLCLGRIVPRKRLDLLLDAFRLVRPKHPEARVLIIGRFSYARGFAALLGDLKPGDGVEYRPAIDRAEVPELLSRVDVVIQPSEMENLGSAVIEGLACGRPVILGPTNGTRDYVSASSIVFEDYTPEAVAAAMMRMIELVRSEPERLAREAREAAEAHVRVEHVVDRLLELVSACRISGDSCL